MYPLEQRAHSGYSRPAGGELLVVIGDHSAVARERLRALLSHNAGVRIVAECSEGPETLQAITRLRPHLAFLEARLPKLDAFALCRSLGELSPKIIFVTSSADDAARAFELAAIDYVVKPYTDARLLLSLERARQAVGSNQVVRTLLREVGGGSDDTLVLRSRTALQLLPMHEIIWVQSQGTSIRIHAAGRSYWLSCTIGEMAPRLPENRFIRVSREGIVNLAQVDEVRKSAAGFEVVLLDRTVVPLGRRYRKAFDARLAPGTLSIVESQDRP
jgi:two-component system LytT family response regulator